MLKNYVLIAWRHILKDKLYAAINIIGLVIGLAVYIFGSLLAEYEVGYDLFFKHSDRIYTVGSILTPSANMGVSEAPGIYTAVAPLIETDAPEVEAVARTVSREFLLTIDGDSYYQGIRFVDPSFARIFDFDYVEGDDRALDDPAGMMITKTTATRLFGQNPALGRTLTLDHNIILHVAAVVQDLPRNTHLNSSMNITGFEVVAPLTALERAAGYDLAGNWDHLSSGDTTYILLPEDKSRVWLQSKLDGIYDRHFPEDEKELVSGFRVRSLPEVNTMVWDMIGMPLIETLQLLALLVLVVAIVNYTNLATAQSLGRTREVGLRKTMGATKTQLLQQFLVESVTIAGIAMLIALALLEVCMPLFNTYADRELIIDYNLTLPWLILTTLLVGLVAGAYPAYVIARAKPIEALRDEGAKGVKGSFFRSIMLGLQSAISIFMLAIVLIVYFQNQQMESRSNIYPRSEILVLQRLGLESIRSRHDTLRTEFANIPGVENVTFSSQVPYEQNHSGMSVGAVAGDKTSSFMIMRIRMDEYFLDSYNIPLLAGRNFDREISTDMFRDDAQSVNVIVNEMALEKLGFGSPANSIGRVFYQFLDDHEEKTGPSLAFTIVGVVPSQNFQGFHNRIKPTTYLMDPNAFINASVRVKGVDMQATLKELESVWDGLVPDYPMQSRFLDGIFDDFYKFFAILSGMLGGFAFLALALSSIGLFGLAAYMVQGRTKEIGLRKVMGANLMQITRLLIWQFSKPVMWAMVVALPAAYFGSNIYLDFFADRLNLTEGIILATGLVAVVFSWTIVALHAVKVARSNPTIALRYE